MNCFHALNDSLSTSTIVIAKNKGPRMRIDNTPKPNNLMVMYEATTRVIIGKSVLTICQTFLGKQFL